MNVNRKTKFVADVKDKDVFDDVFVVETAQEKSKKTGEKYCDGTEG